MSDSVHDDDNCSSIKIKVIDNLSVETSTTTTTTNNNNSKPEYSVLSTKNDESESIISSAAQQHADVVTHKDFKSVAIKLRNVVRVRQIVQSITNSKKQGTKLLLVLLMMFVIYKRNFKVIEQEID
jgi:hypothetical protein